MRKTFLVSLLLSALFVSAQENVLFTEDFDYPDGSVLTVNPDWFLQWGGETHMAIVSPALTFEGYIGSDVGQALLIEGDYSNDQPHHVFEQVKSGDVYVALLLEPTFVTKTGWFLTLRDEKITQSTFNYCGRVYVGVDEEYNTLIGLRFFKKAEAVFADVHLDAEKTYLVVMRYHIVEGNSNDEISLYLFDKMPTEMPSEPLIGPLTDPQAPDINPAHIAFHSFDDDGWLTIDGLRIATTFEDALGPLGTGLDEQTSERAEVRRKMVNGTIIIEKNDEKYSVLGTRLK